MSLRNIFLKLAHDVSRYPNIVQLTNTLDHGFKEVAAHIQDGGSEVEVTPVYTSGEKLATITVDGDDNDIYMPNGEVKSMEGSSFKTVNGSLVDEMKVVFTPIQSGSGTPSPDNVRPISGHTQVQSKINNTTNTTSLGDTYYGGDVEQVSGEGEVTIKKVTFNGTEDDWTTRTTGGGLRLFERTLSDCANMGTPASQPDTVKNSLLGWDLNLAENTFRIVNVGLSINIGTSITTVADFKTWLSSNNIELSYPLATPTTLSLTGQNIVADVGVNEVSAPLTGQSIEEVKYHQMMTIQDVEKLIQ